MLGLMTPGSKHCVNKKAADETSSQRTSGEVKVIERNESDCCEDAAANIIAEFFDGALAHAFPVMIAVTPRENQTAMHSPVNPVFAEGPDDKPQKNARQNGIISQHAIARFLLSADYNPIKTMRPCPWQSMPVAKHVGRKAQ